MCHPSPRSPPRPAATSTRLHDTASHGLTRNKRRPMSCAEPQAGLRLAVISCLFHDYCFVRYCLSKRNVRQVQGRDRRHAKEPLIIAPNRTTARTHQGLCPITGGELGSNFISILEKEFHGFNVNVVMGHMLSYHVQHDNMIKQIWC